jgi:hypothetical protein
MWTSIDQQPFWWSDPDRRPEDGEPRPAGRLGDRLADLVDGGFPVEEHQGARTAASTVPMRVPYRGWWLSGSA